MKKFFTFLCLLAVALTATAANITVANKDGVNIYYNYINSKTELSVAGSDACTTLVIPEEVEVASLGKTLKVTAIGSSAFSKRTDLSEVTLPNSITAINYRAFYECKALASIDLGEGLVSISYQAFMNCVKLTSIKLPDSFTTFSEGGMWDYTGSVFSGCTSLKEITLSKNMTSIASKTFLNCSSLESIVLPSQVKTIENSAFNGCSNLSSFTFNDSVEYLGSYAFANCTKLEKIKLPNSVKGYFKYTSADGAQGTFYGCSSLKEVILSDNLKSIPYKTFYECDSLKSIVIPNSVTNIGIEAFAACKNLVAAVLSDSLKEIPSEMFSGCKKLRTIVLPSHFESCEDNAFTSAKLQNAIFRDDDHVAFDKADTIYSPKDFLTWTNKEFVYSGLAPELEYTNNLPDSIEPVSYDKTVLSKNAGRYEGLSIPFKFANQYIWFTADVPLDYYQIEKAQLTATVNDAERVYGEENPSFGLSYQGLKNNEKAPEWTSAPKLSTTATKESDAGTYPITVSGGVARNYEVTFVDGTLTILKADQLITWEQDLTDLVENHRIELTATASSGLAVSYTVDDESVCKVVTENGKCYLECVGEGSTTIYAVQAGNNNYNEATAVSQTVNVIPDGIANLNYGGGKVKVSKGKLVFNGVGDAQVKVYNLSGALIYQGSDAEIALPQGVYVVKVGELTQKLNVR